MKQELAQKYAELLNERRPHESRTPQVDLDACVRINEQLKLLRVDMLFAHPVLEERIAIAFFLANDRKDVTYDEEKLRYTITDEEAMAWAFKETGHRPPSLTRSAWQCTGATIWRRGPMIS